ncbi:hypothetical protein CNBG_2963 [Cryptococcus deuterogattii R265]|uniref:uncharacterized protein n=1 Tax=Cryptococcus deuterogattii (strain R265) TaxID=294750 RepID=UPI0019350E42|nr:hypothetical protein CNBG_2963 [Cryptococcus deuterogattii R265]
MRGDVEHSSRHQYKHWCEFTTCQFPLLFLRVLLALSAPSPNTPGVTSLTIPTFSTIFCQPGGCLYLPKIFPLKPSSSMPKSGQRGILCAVERQGRGAC